MKRLLIIASIGIVLLFSVGLITWASTSGNPEAHAAAVGDSDNRPLRALVQSDALAPSMTRGQHDLTIVVFSDYQCPYCRKLHHELEAVLRADPKIKLLFRDWPVLGAASIEAAKAAIASQWQNKYAAFNDALMRTPGRLNSASIRRAADQAGVDWAKLQTDLRTRKADIDALLSRNSLYAATLGLQGTPALLVGPYLVPGGIERAKLVEIIAAARKAGPPNTSS